MTINSKETYLEAIKKLNYYTKLYDEGNPAISDEEWDDLYFDCIEFEKQTGFIAENSPSNSIQFDVKNSLNKVTHNHPMLSLAKTKDIEEVKRWAKNNDLIVMAKMDGLTCSLCYENGELISAETRGNGVIGEDILHNAKVIKSIPKKIDFMDRLVVDGEVICKYDDFEEFSGEFKNPRNFASGSIRLLDSSICAKRKLTFVAWDVIEGLEDLDTLDKKLAFISNYFITVPYRCVNIYDVNSFRTLCKQLNYPIDGLVYKYNNVELYNSLGANEHHPVAGLAYKFYDEEYVTKLININWTMGRSGLITPVANFEPVEIDGTTIQNASLHNITIMKETLGDISYVGEEISVFKANLIIPQVASAKNQYNGSQIKLEIPTTCPICGAPTRINKTINTETLVCTNPNCEGKFGNHIKHVVGSHGLDIETMSNKTIDKLIEFGWINSLEDIFKLKDHKEEWLEKDGFGEKSVETILTNIEASKNIDLWKVIAIVGITNIEKQTSILLANTFKTWNNFIQAVNTHYDFSKINGIGIKTASDIINFDYSEIEKIIPYLTIKSLEEKTGNLTNKTFCITGTLSMKRDDIIKIIEENGGKFTGVSKNLDYLISNDKNSNSGKTKKAKELGITIISEDEFLAML